MKISDLCLLLQGEMEKHGDLLVVSPADDLGCRYMTPFVDVKKMCNRQDGDYGYCVCGDVAIDVICIDGIGV